MSAFAVLPVSERRLIIEQVAARRGILPVIVEKDFWVCWILGRIYATPEMATSLVFKGGTSLSKVFGVIQRFSEDADLSVPPHWCSRQEGSGKALDLDPSALRAVSQSCRSNNRAQRSRIENRSSRSLSSSLISAISSRSSCSVPTVIHALILRACRISASERRLVDEMKSLRERCEGKVAERVKPFLHKSAKWPKALTVLFWIVDVLTPGSGGTSGSR